jgi:hypothetical protein
MVLVICEKTGLQFEASSQRTKNHPTIMSWLNVAYTEKWYDEANEVVKQGREQGFTTIEQYTARFKSTQEAAQKARKAQIHAQVERKFAARDAHRERAVTNQFFREHGYRWQKFEHDEEDIDLLGLPEVEWTLYSPDGRAVSTQEAMREIAYEGNKWAKEWLAKHQIEEREPAIIAQRREETEKAAQEAQRQETIYESFDAEHKAYVHEMTPVFVEAGLTPERARKEAIRFAQPHKPEDDTIELGPFSLPDHSPQVMLVINSDGRYGGIDHRGLWIGLQEILDKFPDDAALHAYLSPYLERNARNS